MGVFDQGKKEGPGALIWQVTHPATKWAQLPVSRSRLISRVRERVVGSHCFMDGHPVVVTRIEHLEILFIIHIQAEAAKGRDNEPQPTAEHRADRHFNPLPSVAPAQPTVQTTGPACSQERCLQAQG